MSDSIANEKQILENSATFIRTVVYAVMNPELRPQLENHLLEVENNGWHNLILAIRGIMRGNSDEAALESLDNDEKIIIKAILQGIQNPDTLPSIKQQSNPASAAPGIAGMIQAASRGDTNALQMLSAMAEKMEKSGPEMTETAAIMRRILDGERNVVDLTDGLDDQSKMLVASVLLELAKTPSIH